MDVNKVNAILTWFICCGYLSYICCWHQQRNKRLCQRTHEERWGRYLKNAVESMYVRYFRFCLFFLWRQSPFEEKTMDVPFWMVEWVENPKKIKKNHFVWCCCGGSYMKEPWKTNWRNSEYTWDQFFKPFLGFHLRKNEENFRIFLLTLIYY